jgi:hypothetical protein
LQRAHRILLCLNRPTGRLTDRPTDQECVMSANSLYMILTFSFVFSGLDALRSYYFFFFNFVVCYFSFYKIRRHKNNDLTLKCGRKDELSDRLHLLFECIQWLHFLIPILDSGFWDSFSPGVFLILNNWCRPQCPRWITEKKICSNTFEWRIIGIEETIK